MNLVKEYYKKIAQVAGLVFVELEHLSIDKNLLQVTNREFYIQHQAIPIKISNDEILIVTADPSEKNINSLRDFYASDTRILKFSVSSRQSINAVIIKFFEKEYAREIVYKHHEIDYTHSALYTFSKGEKFFIICLIFFMMGMFIFKPIPTLVASMTVLTFGTLITMMYKCYLSAVSISYNLPASVPMDPREVSNDVLPIYTVLIPLFHEKENTISFLMKSMEKIDYPVDKLDIKLLLEEDDDSTAEIITQMNLPPHYEMIKVPDGKPRSKPRACNLGLEFARGEFVTIYDAEDCPDSDQLKKAWLDLSDDKFKHVCTQAALNYYNNKENILTHLCALEYTHWFDQLVPALAYLKVPVPLGGTSNHFRIGFLQEVKGWDPSIGTEDADIGMRIYRHGYRTSALRSTTYEEAPGQFINWFKQRSRWNKGYFQTYLVNMRDPIQFIKEVGFRKFMAFKLFVGGNVFVSLANFPIWIYFLVSLVLSPELIDTVQYDTLYYAQLFNFFIGNVLLIISQFIGAYKRGDYFLLKYTPLIPIYWLFMSIAGYFALYDLLIRPGYWYKTEHGTSKMLEKE